MVHTSRIFESELRELHAQALAMGEHCKRIVRIAFEAFWQGKPSLAVEVPEIEAQIDEEEIGMHALALRIIALRQPVADDLRFLTAAIRLVTDLERVGDEAVNITERVVEGADQAKSSVGTELCAMDREVQAMLQDGLRAFVERDPERARDVIRRDDVVDAHCAAVIAKMTDYVAAHAEDVPAGLRVMWVANHLERIADHATNVAEEVIFMVRGEDVRHEPV
jgi:phosphate transport system protein